MNLAGSCHCGAVHFTAETHHPVPYQRCYCSICRKTQGGGGYAINIAADAATLKIRGKDAIAVYHAKMHSPGKPDHISTGQRHFCRHCASALWLFSPEWPDLIHPFASAIDTPLPTPAATTHIMLAFKPDWVEIPHARHDILCDGYPDESIADWHQRHHSEI